MTGLTIYANGLTYGSFQNINFIGAHSAATAANNVLAINTISDLAYMGVTGANLIGTGAASGLMIKWNNVISPVRGTIGVTTVGTAAGYLTVQNSAWYEIRSKIQFTGLPSGTVIQTQQFLGATGSFGSGTPVAQSVVFSPVFGASPINYSTVNQDYLAYIPSGTNISTFCNYISGGGGSGIAISPTGTFFNLRNVGA